MSSHIGLGRGRNGAVFVPCSRSEIGTVLYRRIREIEPERLRVELPGESRNFASGSRTEHVCWTESTLKEVKNEEPQESQRGGQDGQFPSAS